MLVIVSNWNTRNDWFCFYFFDDYFLALLWYMRCNIQIWRCCCTCWLWFFLAFLLFCNLIFNLLRIKTTNLFFNFKIITNWVCLHRSTPFLFKTFRFKQSFIRIQTKFCLLYCFHPFVNFRFVIVIDFIAKLLLCKRWLKNAKLLTTNLTLPAHWFVLRTVRNDCVCIIKDRTSIYILISPIEILDFTIFIKYECPQLFSL